MVMLSTLLRRGVVDGQGRRARLEDLVLDPTAAAHPPVTAIVYRGRGDVARELPWDAVPIDDVAGGCLAVPDVTGGRPVEAEAAARELRLKRDVLDALVIDLRDGRALRANDLWLDAEDGRLTLRAVDGSPWGIVRRLTRQLVDRGEDLDLRDWAAIAFLRGDAHAATTAIGPRDRIRQLPPGEVARLIELLPYRHAVELLTLLPDPVAADTLEDMSAARQVQVVEELDDDQAVRLLALTAPNAAADILGQLDPAVARRYLERLPDERRARVTDLLRYPADVAGGIMTNDVVVVAAGLTVAEARRVLRKELAAPDLVYYVYVVDAPATRRLRGVLTLRTLLVADETEKVEAVMDPYLVTIAPLESAVDAAQRVIDNQLLALPVVARDGRLLGVVTVDAAVATIAPPSWRALAPRVFS